MESVANTLSNRRFPSPQRLAFDSRSNLNFFQVLFQPLIEIVHLTIVTQFISPYKIRHVTTSYTLSHCFSSWCLQPINESYLYRVKSFIAE